MGSILGKAQVNPRAPTAHLNSHKLKLESEGEISRANFTFSSQLASDGYLHQNTLWLANIVTDPNQQYLVRQYDKVYDHKRVQAVLRELKIFTNVDNPFLAKIHSAFQDERSLYMVSEALDSLPLSQLFHCHIFSQEETKYVVMALISIIQDVHTLGYALTQLSPQHIHIGIRQGQLKLLQVPNPIPLNGLYSCNAVGSVCPYSAPEILCRDKVLAECDYYSLGMIMYEMMTQTKAYPLKDNDPQFTRNALLKGVIEVQKSQIPEDWKTQAADFLIKLLIKNPVLRLGRYGSFEVMNHPWLKGYSGQDNKRGRIRLAINEIEGVITQVVEEKEEEDKNLDSLLSNHYFQMQFSEYNYTRPLNEKETSEEQLEEISLDKTSFFENQSNLKFKHGL